MVKSLRSVSSAGDYGGKDNVGYIIIPFFVITFLTFVVACGILICAIFMKVNYDDMPDIIFHIWVAVPLLVVVVISVIAMIRSGTFWYSLVLMLSLLVLIICTYAAMSSGIILYEESWKLVNKELDNDACAVTASGQCECPRVYLTPKIGSDTDCDDLEIVTKSFISEVALSAIGAFLCFLSTLLAMIILFCRPWANLKFDKLSEGSVDNYDSGNVRILGGRNIGTMGHYHR